MRLIAKLLAVAASPFLIAPAFAGDAAELNILGFLEDGSVFAFEEFGIQDGSGFPYANRFYIDTASDSFVAGTPIRVRIDDEGATLQDARDEAYKRGQTIAIDRELAANRGVTAAHNPITELSADPHRVMVNPRPVVPPVDKPVEFRLEEMTLETPENCQGFGDTKGFRLKRIALEPEAQTELVHEDTSAVPTSRRCPLGYSIGAVQTFFPAEGDPLYVVLVAVRSVGFEGPDHRWIAVPGKL
ncbi:DUF2259 domain-containing protein [Mesorhizobium sp. CAU 1732]|uniref:DUF2259 domain-containing protein n=1 Tax=Mesorhizobium sp. CAU 1732 TaxID=3140358 RepID=UPI00326071A2